MSEAQAHVSAALEWDTADRMRKALRVAGVSVGDMAIYLGVNRNTVGNWMNGRTPPPVSALRAWGARCAVTYEWLAFGQLSGPDGGGKQHADVTHQ